MILLNHGGFLISQYIYIYIYIYILYIYISQYRFFIQKHHVYFLISQNRFCDIKNRFGYIKFDFVISQSGGFIQVSFRTLSITTFNSQKPKAQIYICICEFFRFQSRKLCTVGQS